MLKNRDMDKHENEWIRASVFFLLLKILSLTMLSRPNVSRKIRGKTKEIFLVCVRIKKNFPIKNYINRLVMVMRD